MKSPPSLTDVQQLAELQRRWQIAHKIAIDSEKIEDEQAADIFESEFRTLARQLADG